MLRRLQNIYRRMWQEKAKGTPPKEAPAVAHAHHPEDDEPMQPPAPSRIARRALCLAAVCFRGFLETFDEAERAKAHSALLKWLAQAGLDQELEPNESEAIHTPPGMLDRRTLVNCTWRSEGIVVLLHVLGRLALPSHHQRCDPREACEAAGLWREQPQIDELVSSAKLATVELPDQLAARMLAIHWRLRQFCHVSQEQIDFAQFAAGVQWARFDLTGVTLVDGDLAVGDKTLAQADPDQVQETMSIAVERHQAANWLCGWDPEYGAVDTPT